ncbi:AMP-binding protein [Ramlibacter terrae]|uniref:AMP-binding protein n=1 Tax=Ramlibacter terrae TaxID=2732511 RepID=A0ABX6P4V0_9BURK|nr:AMP-binding protein [Ramlibacter terrae]
MRLGPDRPAVESPRLSMTYGELQQRALRLQARLQQAGVRRGDAVCILSENDPDFLTLSIAALRIGAPVATLNTRLLVPEIAHCIRLVAPKVIFASKRMQAQFRGSTGTARNWFRLGPARHSLPNCHGPTPPRRRRMVRSRTRKISSS